MSAPNVPLEQYVTSWAISQEHGLYLSRGSCSDRAILQVTKAEKNSSNSLLVSRATQNIKPVPWPGSSRCGIKISYGIHEPHNIRPTVSRFQQTIWFTEDQHDFADLTLRACYIFRRVFEAYRGITDEG